jgi:uncharacterized delta-60 repeat protein
MIQLLATRRKSLTSSRPRKRRGHRPSLEPLEGRALMSGPGSLDATFNGTGIRTHSMMGAGWSGENFVAVQADGKPLVEGNVLNAKTRQGEIGLTRFNVDGSIDAGFGTNGVASVGADAGASAMGITIQPDGKILVCGMASKSRLSPSYANEYLVARLNTDGSLDTSFASKGKFVWDATQYSDVAQSMAVLSDGSIVVGGKGSSLVPSSGSNLLVFSYTAFKLTAQGKLVTTFGDKGEFRYNFGNQGGTMNAMAVAPNGDIILAGDRLVALTPAGRLDTAFNGTGVITPPVATFQDVAIQNGKIIAAGGATVARYTLTGALDPTFGSGGTFTTGALGISSVAVESDGSLVLGGSHIYESVPDPDGNPWTVDHHELAVAHLTADGAVDTSFGGLGTGVVDVRPDVDASITDLVVGPGGKITACGNRYVARFTSPAL